MITKKMVDALNKQINEELFSSYLYLSMAAYFEAKNLKGFSNWMMVQQKEEMDHAMKFYNYINSTGGKVKLLALAEPSSEWNSPLHAFEETLKHEQHITKCINDLVDLAEQGKDRATFNMLQWYVDEQIEEEENDNDIIEKLKLVGENGNGMFMLDKELAQRVYTPITK